MSQEKQSDQVIGLEELFLSREFGQEPSGGTAPAGPLVPLVLTASEVAGHASTTHRRRNAFAALSGTAAALLVVLGLIGGPGRPTPLDHSASPSTPSGRGGPPPGFERGAGISADTSVGSGQPASATPFGSGPTRRTGAGTSVSLADLTTAASAGVTPPQSSDGPGGTSLPASRVVPAGSGPGTGSTTPAPSPAPSGDPLASVTSSVGSVVPGASTAVSGLVTTITTGLPAAPPPPLTAGPLGAA
jgi:hypothetical protein